MSINWPDETLKALIASRVFELSVEYRMCAIDYECGGWEEIQSMYGPEQQAQWLEEAAEWKFPAEYDDYTEAGMIRKACVGRDYAVKLCYPDGCEHWELIPDYHNDIAAAWEVVDWMLGQGWNIALQCWNRGGSWSASIKGGIWGENWQKRLVFLFAPTASRAICEAALKALETAGGNNREAT